ncbi:MAG: bifunctional hydroxymethylpyrimidine kinase/phosphomethylpyrimidine kinase [Myxococcota bacterium]
MTPTALTIAGSDPSGGAGLQADLKTFHQHQVYGMAVVTLVTVQNTQAVSRVEVLAADLVAQQLDAVLADIPPGVVKTGALGNAAVVEVVAERAARLSCPVVVDPVMVSKHGHALLADDAVRAFTKHLLPVTTLLTPNTQEAEALLGRPVRTVEEAREAARRLGGMGPRAVLVKGGHLEGDAVDVLFHQGEVHDFHAPRIHSPHTHGTGCTYASAIAAWLARGVPLLEAVPRAKTWLTEAIRTPPGLGHGVGPVNHLVSVPR